MTSSWPELDYPGWRDTCNALHLYTQIVGKYRLARTPWVNHSWHATLYVSGRGLTTSLVPDTPGGIEIVFDLLDDTVKGMSTDGKTASFALEPMSVAAFHERFVQMIRALGGTPVFHDKPNEVPDPVQFEQDHEPRPYDADAVGRFFQVLVAVQNVLQKFRTACLGKVSPVHLFWGSFDLAVTRFSGRPAPLHPGGIPGLPDAVTREAYSHEVSSAGFWPGGGPVEYAAFYAYAYPAPDGFADAAVQPPEAFFHQEYGEFILPYDAVRQSNEPEETLLSFLQSTYEAAAISAEWDCPALECDMGIPLRPRPLRR